MISSEGSHQDSSKVAKDRSSPSHQDARRGREQIRAAIEEMEAKIWYDRHRMLLQEGKLGADAMERAESAARTIEATYGMPNLGPSTDFEWGMLNGKLSALRWAMGDEWDFLDT